LTQTIMAAVEMNVLGTYLTGGALAGDDLWLYCRAAVAAPAPARLTKR
jgi:hypothetical protein